MSPEEVAHERGDLGGVGLEREVAGIEQMDLGVGEIALERLCAGGQERGVVLAPRGEERRPVLAEVGLELRVEGDVRAIVEDQIELDLLRAGPRQVGGVERPAVGRDERRSARAVQACQVSQCRESPSR